MLKTVLYVAAPIFGIFFFLSLSGLAYYASLPPTVQLGERENTAIPKIEERQKNGGAIRRFVRFLFPDASAIFTFFLTLATIGLVYVAYIQIKLLKRAEIISDSSSQAAKDSAAIAKQTAEATSRSERPYLFMTGLKITQVFTDRLPRIQATFKNAGKTPAFVLDCVYAITLEDLGQSAAPAAVLRANAAPCGMIGETIGGDKVGEKLHIFDSYPIPEVMPDVFRGMKRLILVGEVSYGDVFGNVHTEGFGYSVSVPTPADFEREKDRQGGAETDFPINYFFRLTGIDSYGYRRTEPKSEWRRFYERTKVEQGIPSPSSPPEKQVDR